MPRKYSGPLMPGQKSARVPKRNSKKATKPVPTKVKTAIKQEVKKEVNKNLETKLVRLQNYDEVQPDPIQLGALCYYSAYVLGPGQPGTWTGNFNPLLGVKIAEGTAQNQRAGDYVNLKKSHLTLQIDMNHGIEANCLHEFRVIMFRLNRKNNPGNVTPDPSYNLFLDPAGNATGHSVGGFNGTDAICQPLNKRDFIIHYDKTFTLSPPSTFPTQEDTSIGYSGYYGSHRRIILNMNHNKKVKYGDGPNPLPLNYDYNIGLIIYARSVGKDIFASKWEVNTRGTTSFTDP